MQVQKQKATEGWNLLKVTFQPDDPDPSKAPEVIVIYRVESTGKTPVLEFRSATREDTREAVILTEEQKEAIFEALSSYLEDIDDSPFWGKGS